MSEPFYEFKVFAGTFDTLEAKEAALNVLGREGWYIAGVTPIAIYLQRLVSEEPVVEAVGGEPVQEEETVDPLCGCGCGESVIVGLVAWQQAVHTGRVWYLAGHGGEAAQHQGQYAAAPRRPGKEA